MGQSESLAWAQGCPQVDSNHDGFANSNDAKGVLLGDANGDGLTNGTENTLFVSLAAAQQIIAASGSSAAPG
jgi:hypothetical protein